MKSSYLGLSPIAMLVACASQVPSFIDAPPAGAAMSVAECRLAEVCTIRGELSIIESDGIAMGELSQGEGQCITLSLSRNDIRYLRQSGPIEATVSGRVYKGHHDPNSLLLEIEGRQIGYPRCGEFYLFVP